MQVDAGWLVQIFQMTDRGTQQSVVDLLTGVGGFSVDARTCERGSFLIIESEDSTRALNVYELVMTADPFAELIHSTTGPRQGQAMPG